MSEGFFVTSKDGDEWVPSSTDHTPEPCGCRVERTTTATGKFVVGHRIIYCPTHAAAGDYEKALQDIADVPIALPMDGTTTDYEGACFQMQAIARAAIAQATGGEEPIDQRSYNVGWRDAMAQANPPEATGSEVTVDD